MSEIKITIEGAEYKVRQSFRSLMLFEEMTKRSVYLMNETLNDIMTLFYCILKANNRETFTYTFDSFIDVMDNNPDCIEVFTDFIKTSAEVTDEPASQKKKK